MSLDNVNLELCIHQKLTLMANAVARISFVKSQLRNSAERTRKDISNAIDHQLSCVRAREQELIFSLERIVSEKEQILSAQQEQLNQAIGACQQSLECVLRNAASGNTESTPNHYDPATLSKMLFKMNSLELRPKDNSHILFEFDPSDLRRDISVFGKILAVDHHQAKAAESLPMDVEHYEDDALLSHKSVLRLSQASPRPFEKSSTNQKASDNRVSDFFDSINYWLAQVKSSDNKVDMDFIRDQILCPSSTSSFDIVQGDKENAADPCSNAFEAHFSEINEKPLGYWLLKKDHGVPDLSTFIKEFEMKIQDRKEEYGDAEISNEAEQENQMKPNGFAFGEMIKAIQSSSDEDWLLGDRSNSSPMRVDSSSSIRQNSISFGLTWIQKEKNDETTSANWFRRFPNLQSMERKPAGDANELCDVCNPVSVFEWKGIMDKLNSRNS